MLVNPSGRRVIDEIRRREPDLSCAEPELRRSSSRLQVIKWVLIALLIGSSLGAECPGQTSVSWLIDAVAVTSYLVMRGLRRRVGRRHRVPDSVSG